MKIFTAFPALNITNYLFGGTLADKFDLYIKISRLSLSASIGSWHRKRLGRQFAVSLC